MSSSKRVSAPRLEDLEDRKAVPSDWSAVSRERFVPYLNHITEGCTIIDVDPSACIPLFLSRDKSVNAVKRLVSILNGDFNEDQGAFGLTGMVAGTPTSVVVPLVRTLAHLVDDHFERLHDNPEDRKCQKEKHNEWFGVVDGCHYQCALIELREKLPAKWNSVSWKVFSVREGHELSEYRKLAIVQNERNKAMYHYEPTLFDTLTTLRDIYDDLHAKRLKVSRTGKRGVSIHHRDVAFMYDGGDHSRNTTVRQAVSVAARLSRRTIEAIGFVANMSCVDLILSNSRLNEHSLTSSDSVMSRYDCRVFRKFVSISTLRGARNFMNAVRDKEEEAQVNAVHRARHWVEMNDFRALKPTDLNVQFILAKLALYEEAKFLVYIDSTSWPANMGTTRENLLRTTTHDKSLKANEGNTTDVLKDVWDCFKRLYPGRAKGIEERENASSGSVTGDEQEEESNVVPEVMPDKDDDVNEMSEEKKRQLLEDEVKKKEVLRQANLRKSAESLLNDIGIVTHDVGFEEFRKDIWSPTSSRVDLVLSAVPQSTTEESLCECLPTFCRTVLKTGSYVFLILTDNSLHKYQEAFRTAGFKVCDHGFNIVYDTSTMKRRKTKDFPLKNCEVAMIAKTQGRHPSNFEPDFLSQQSPNTSHSCAHSPFASLLNVQSCEEKLKRPNENTAIFPHERSTQLFARIINMFSPTQGSVLDPFGGPLTTALACLETSRTCTSMDYKGVAMQYSKSRLRIHAMPKATMADLEIFIDPSPSTPAICDDASAKEASSTPIKSKRKSPHADPDISQKKVRVCNIAKSKETGLTKTSSVVDSESVQEPNYGEHLEYIEEDGTTVPIDTIGVSDTKETVTEEDNISERGSGCDNEIQSLETDSAPSSKLASSEEMVGADALLSFRNK